jgi:hypothetical protein
MTTATDRLLRAVLVLGLAATLPGLWLGLFMISNDLDATGEWLDGVGLLIGLVVLAALLLPGGLAAWALRRSVQERRDAPAWALAAALTGLASAGVFAWNDPHLLPFGAAPLLVGVIAAAMLLARRTG